MSFQRMINLKSSDGKVFPVTVFMASQSQIIKYVIEDGCADNEIPLDNVTSEILSKIIEFLRLKALDVDRVFQDALFRRIGDHRCRLFIEVILNKQDEIDSMLAGAYNPSHNVKSMVAVEEEEECHFNDRVESILIEDFNAFNENVLDHWDKFQHTLPIICHNGDRLKEVESMLANKRIALRNSMLNGWDRVESAVGEYDEFSLSHLGKVKSALASYRGNIVKYVLDCWHTAESRLADVSVKSLLSVEREALAMGAFNSWDEVKFMLADTYVNHYLYYLGKINSMHSMPGEELEAWDTDYFKAWLRRIMVQRKLQHKQKNWKREFVEVNKSIIYDLIMAANYLDIKSLLDLTCQADMIMGKTPDEIRKILNLKSDRTPEEEEQVRRENQWAFE